MEMMFNVGDIKSIIMESSTEFKAKVGDGVESDDKKNSDKAYKDAKKRGQEFDGGLKDNAEKKPKYEKIDGNRTTLDYNVDNATPEYKKRIAAQAEGYTSEAEKNNGIEKQGDYKENKEIFDAIKKTGKEIHANEKALKQTGLQGRMMPKDTFDREEMYESKEGFEMKKMLENVRNIQKSNVSENHNVKTVYFKKTEFINEAHMISRVPDEFKNEGCIFKMKDKTGSEYLLEWTNNTGKVLNHVNEEGFKTAVNEINSLSSYKSKESNTTRSTRLNENDETFENMLNKVRDLK